MALQGPLVLLLTTVVCCVGVTNATNCPLGFWYLLWHFQVFHRMRVSNLSRGHSVELWTHWGRWKRPRLHPLFWGSRTSTKETPLGWCQEWKLAIASVLLFFFLGNNNQKKGGSLLAYTVVQRMQKLWFASFGFGDFHLDCVGATCLFTNKTCRKDLGFSTYKPLTVPSTRAPSLHQQQPGGT